jgi:hypothetical protein
MRNHRVGLVSVTDQFCGAGGRSKGASLIGLGFLEGSVLWK